MLFVSEFFCMPSLAVHGHPNDSAIGICDPGRVATPRITVRIHDGNRHKMCTLSEFLLSDKLGMKLPQGGISEHKLLYFLYVHKPIMINCNLFNFHLFCFHA